jgi:hypothetical protein
MKPWLAAFALAVVATPWHSLKRKWGPVIYARHWLFD